MESADDRVERHIQDAVPGTIFFAEDFEDYGTPGAVRTALYRMAKRGLVERMAHGIYAKPKESNLIGEYLPSTEDVAEALARRDRARILPTGTYAQHVLGLSTQLPLNLVFLTDGPPRTVTIGKRTIQFKKTAPRYLEMRGKLSRLAVQAIREYGKDKVPTEIEEKIIELLRKEERADLKHDIRLAPQWIAEILAKALYNGSY